MAFDSAYYLVTRDICSRAGLLGKRYRSEDGRFILSNKDLARVRFTSDEFVSGLQGVQKITESEAVNLIRRGGNTMTPMEENTVSETVTETATETTEESVEETTDETTEEVAEETAEEAVEEAAEEEVTTNDEEEAQ